MASTTAMKKIIGKNSFEQCDEGGKVFACRHPGCSKWFSKRYNLKAHSRLHTGTTPFCCPRDDCEREFKWRSSLSSHVAWHLRKDSGEVVREYSPKRRAKQLALRRQAFKTQRLSGKSPSGGCSDGTGRRYPEKGSPRLADDNVISLSVASEVGSEETAVTVGGNAEVRSLQCEESTEVSRVRDEILTSSGSGASVFVSEHYSKPSQEAFGDGAASLFSQVMSENSDQTLNNYGDEVSFTPQTHQVHQALVQSGFSAACETLNIIDGSDTPELICLSNGLEVEGSRLSSFAAPPPEQKDADQNSTSDMELRTEYASQQTCYGLYQGGDASDDSIALF